MRYVLLFLFVTSAVTAQDVSLGDPITFRGVTVDGFAHGAHVSRIQRRHDIRISIGSGRARGGTIVHVCGVDATRIERETAAVPSVRVQIPNGGPSGHLITPDRPRTTTVTVVIPRGEGAVSIAWAVPTAQRSRWRALEDAFFASIRCVD